MMVLKAMAFTDMLIPVWEIRLMTATISIFTKNFSRLVQACTSLCKLVQVITVHQVTSQQAKSKFRKVFCLFSQPIMTSWQEPTSFGILVQAGLKDIGSNNHIKIHTIDTK